LKKNFRCEKLAKYYELINAKASQMYLKLFGFQEKPFHITPNPRFIFLSKTHREAFAHLLYGIQQRVGFLSLTGEVGTGKTTVLRTLLQQLEESDFRVALIFNPCLNALELLQAIHREFGIAFDRDRANLPQLHDSLNDFLLQQRQAGKTVVLVVDEAQDLDPAVLEQLRLLSNLETPTEKLIQMVLVGQPELEQILRRKDLRQLRQRLAVRYHLEPLDASDTAAYVLHRLRVAGWQGAGLFSEKALRLIFQSTGGTPRLINLLCDRALLVAYGRDSDSVSLRDIRLAKNELEPASPARKPYFALFAGLLLALLVLLGNYLMPLSRPPLLAGEAAREQKPAGTIPALHGETAGGERVDSNRSGRLTAAIAAITPAASVEQTFLALAGRWQREMPTPSLKTGSPATVKAALTTAGYTSVELQTRFAELLRIDAPVLLRIILPGIPGKRLFALTAANTAAVRIEPALTESGWLSKEELEQIWFGRAVLPFINYQDLPLVGKPGQQGESVAALQKLLRQAGLIDTPESGVYDPQTIEVVTRFQAERQLAPDGRVGARTLFWLYKEAGFKMPKLISGEPQ
jgi:general secretion pathway protein A